jgi:2-methylcitrate dehydratase PrpD
VGVRAFLVKIGATGRRGMDVTEKLAGFVAEVKYENLPQEVIVSAKQLVLDCLGVAIAGTTSPVGQIIVKFGKETREGSDATVVGDGFTTSVPTAAFVNGTLAHALDIDDTAAHTVAHPSAPVLPALLAIGERFKLSGKTLLTAYVLGLEVFYRLALASEGLMMGWHRTSVFGAIAAAAAASRLMNLDVEQIRAAIGICSSLTSGLQLNFGTMTKSVQVGNASRSGVVAAMLAKEGVTANLDALGDPRGFGYAFYSGRFVPEKITKDLGNPFNIVFPGIGMKIYPCCGLTHPVIDIALELVKEHNLSYDQVEKVEVYTEELSPQVLVYHQPKTGYEGKYSLEYVIAAAILDREITPETFTDDKVNRPEIRGFLGIVEGKIRSDAEWQDMRLHSWNHPARVIIKLKNGRKYSGEAPCARGYPDLPLSTEEIDSKYRNCAGLVLSAEKVEHLRQVVLTLEAQKDIAELMSLTCR